MVKEHYNEALTLFPKDRIVGVYLQGSQNYGLAIETSDVDTKCILVPSFQDVVMNRKPISHTHVKENNEHIDLKDIRLYMQCFKKQNLNFLEILFTQYKIVNQLYEDEWNRLVEAREEVARYCPYRAVKSMYGIALEKYHALEHEYPSKIEVLKQYGYDPKQLHHLLRVEDYLERYINGEQYEKCLRPLDPEYLKSVKKGLYNLDDARIIANSVMAHIEQLMKDYCDKNKCSYDVKVKELLDDVAYQIMKISVKEEIEND